MTRHHVRLGAIALGLALTIAGLGPFASPTVPAQSAAPTLTSHALPTDLPAFGSASGRIGFRDPQGDLLRAEVRVIDGKFNPFRVPIGRERAAIAQEETPPTGSVELPLECRFAEQRLRLRLTLHDRQGHTSVPHAFSVTCGDPPIGNYDAEQARDRPIDQTAPMALFILDDGINALARGASYPSPQAALGRPRPLVERAVEEQIVTSVNGIWDQCGIGFRLRNLGVVRPHALDLEDGASLAEELFARGTGRLPDVAIASDPLGTLGDARAQLLGDADADPLTAFVTSARVVAEAGDDRQFGGVTLIGGRTSIIRWDAAMPATPGGSSDARARDGASGAVIEEPTRPVTAIAHEFGHNFGLRHVSAPQDELNLMFHNPEGRATAVPPQPPVRLAADQCRQVRDVLEER